MATPEEMAAKMRANMQEKTGKSHEEWLRLAKSSGAKKHGEIVAHLKKEHGLGHGFANLVAHDFLDAGASGRGGGDVDLVTAQYGGGKEGLKPIYDKLVNSVASFGQDVEISPKKTYVSLRRSKQFGLIQPSTKTRVDVGINLKGVAPAGALEASGSFNSMVSHRVRVESVDDIDSKLIGWLKQAYENA
ncbi:MAG: DUF4287 domain-containing protein [Phycisphaerae bacterium]